MSEDKNNKTVTIFLLCFAVTILLCVDAAKEHGKGLTERKIVYAIAQAQTTGKAKVGAITIWKCEDGCEGQMVIGIQGGQQ